MHIFFKHDQDEYMQHAALHIGCQHQEKIKIVYFHFVHVIGGLGLNPEVCKWQQICFSKYSKAIDTTLISQFQITVYDTKSSGFPLFYGIILALKPNSVSSFWFGSLAQSIALIGIGSDIH